MRGPAILVLPLLILLFVVQVWAAFEIYHAWGFWWALLTLLVIGLIANRASRASWLRALFFPHWAVRHESRRHLFQGILFIAAALTWFLPRMDHSFLAPNWSAWVESWPQPWLPLTIAASLVKSALR